MEQSAKYQQIPVAVSAGRLDMARVPRDQVVILDVCNLCGAVVGNKPAHDVFCYSVAGPSAENYR